MHTAVQWLGLHLCWWNGISSVQQLKVLRSKKLGSEIPGNHMGCVHASAPCVTLGKGGTTGAPLGRCV
jgi:hypothetical protein